MPVILKKTYNIPGNYTPNEIIYIQELIDAFRTRVSDDVEDKNILNGKMLYYSDASVLNLLKLALGDLNHGYPKTTYNLISFTDNSLLVHGAVVFSLMKEGLLQLRNQIDYNDSGLSVAMFNKTGAYQGWAGFIMQTYLSLKAEWKSALIPLSANSGFVGVGSEFGYRMW